MFKKILFLIMVVTLTTFVGIFALYGESAKGMRVFIDDAIASDDYTGFLKYNDYYIDTPLTIVDTEEYAVRIHNAYDSDVQNITFIIVDKSFSEGDASQIKITCDEEFLFEDVFYQYEGGLLAVLYLNQSGDSESSLNDSCQDGVLNNVQIVSNSGEVILDLDDQIQFIEDDDLINNGSTGYSEFESTDIQYPRGMIVPLLLPIGLLWISIIGLVFIYKKIFKK